MNVTSTGHAIYCSPCHAGAADAARTGGRCSGDNDGNSDQATGRIAGNGGFGKLISSVFETLSQTLATSAGTPAAAAGTAAASAEGAAAADPGKSTDPASSQNVLQQVASFMQTLFSALAQSQGRGEHHGHGHRHHGHHHRESASAPAIAPADAAAVSAADAAPAAAKPDAPADAAQTPAAAVAAPAVAGSATAAAEAQPTGDSVPATSLSTGFARAYGHPGRHLGLVAKLQSLLQQVPGTGDAGQATGPLAELNKSFQDLVNALRPAGSSEGAAQPTLQDFLQNLLRNITGAGTDSVTATGNVINATA